MAKTVCVDARMWFQGGVGRYIRNLVYNLLLKKRKYDLHIILLEKDVGLLKLPKPQQTNIYIHTTKAKWHTLAEQVLLYNFLRKMEFDLVHFPYFSHPVLYNKPFVVTMHDIIMRTHATGKASTKPLPIYLLKYLMYRMVLRHAILRAKKIITCSQSVARQIAALYPSTEKNITSVYLGVDKELKQKNPQSVFEIPFNNFYLYVGNCYPHKNTDLILKVMQMDSKICFIFVSPNDRFTASVVNKAGVMGVQKQLLVVHNLSDEGLSWLYAKAEALVLPSFAEGFGLPIIEAAAHKCRLILSDIDVFHEIAPQKAVFFLSHSAVELLNILKKTRHIKIEYPKSYFDKFSYSKMAEKVNSVYMELLPSS